MNSDPIISVCIVTYNHGRYIERCIQSVLDQVTSVPIEICIGEDSSSDNTGEICKQLAEANPEVIRLFHRSREDVIYINGKPSGRSNFMKTLKACRGKYIAILDGDDYWTDPAKLERQYQQMEDNPSINLCWTRASYVDANGSEVGNINPEVSFSSGYYSQGELIKSWNANTATLMIRKEALLPLPGWFSKVVSADKVLAYWPLRSGRAYLQNEVTAAYRVHDQSITRHTHFRGADFVNREWQMFKWLKADAAITDMAVVKSRIFHLQMKHALHPSLSFFQSLWIWFKTVTNVRLWHSKMLKKAKANLLRIFKEKL